MFGIWPRSRVHRGTYRAGDPAFPFGAYADLRSPNDVSVMQLLANGGGEHIYIESRSRKALDAAINRLGLRTHPRLRSLTLSGPEGVIERIER